jgi:hypothetical protein
MLQVATEYLHAQRFSLCLYSLSLSPSAGPTGDTTFPNLSCHASEMFDPVFRRISEAVPGEEQ